MKDEEFEIPERFKNIINTGKTKKLHKESPLVLEPHKGYYRVEGETTKNKNDYKNNDEYKKCFNKNGKNVTIDLDDCSILTKEML